MIVKKIFFNATDGVELFGLLHLPEKIKTNVVVIGVHGFSSASVSHKRDDVIATNLTDKGFAYFCFDNRGACFSKKLKINVDGKQKNIFGGSIYEDIVDGKHDVLGAINAMKENGFEKFILQGHSLGCSKVMITYHHLLKEADASLLSQIVACVFLSPVDSKTLILDKDPQRAKELFELASKLVENGKENELVPDAILKTPKSAKSLKSLIENIDEINLPIESAGGNFDKFNAMKCPIFICYGEKDMTISETKNLVALAKKKIKTNLKGTAVIAGADHSYKNRYQELATAITSFVESLKIK
jgi:pimeloyl-ACP methyl ester carboxylesterase